MSNDERKQVLTVNVHDPVVSYVIPVDDGTDAVRYAIATTNGGLNGTLNVIVDRESLARFVAAAEAGMDRVDAARAGKNEQMAGAA